MTWYWIRWQATHFTTLKAFQPFFPRTNLSSPSKMASRAGGKMCGSSLVEHQENRMNMYERSQLPWGSGCQDPSCSFTPANSDFTQHGKPPVENSRGEVAWDISATRWDASPLLLSAFSFAGIHLAYLVSCFNPVNQQKMISFLKIDLLAHFYSGLVSCIGQWVVRSSPAAALG